MMSKKKLTKEYEALDTERLRLLSENLELSYRLKNLEADYKRERDQSDVIKNLHEDARRLKHDMKNHIMVIAAYLNANEIDEAKDYLSKLMDKLNISYSHIETGNSIMNYILNTKLEAAVKEGILVKAEIENILFMRMESVDFSALLSNLLDNAIEAAQANGKKEINISVLRKRGYDTILVKNSINQSVLNENPQLNTSKPDKEGHGFGIRQVRNIIEKYDGMIDFYEENGMFCVYAVILSE